MKILIRNASHHEGQLVLWNSIYSKFQGRIDVLLAVNRVPVVCTQANFNIIKCEWVITTKIGVLLGGNEVKL